MKKLLLVFAVLFIGLSSINAQSSNEPIVIEKTFLGRKYYQGDKAIRRISDLKDIVANDELALKEMKKADVANGFSLVLSVVGGFAVGWELGCWIYDRFNPYVFGVGAGVAAVGIGLSALTNSHVKKGVMIYNENLGKTSCGDPIQLDFGLTPGGVGLTLSF